jgi:2-dehydro-3-deoxygluconokinase
MNPLGRMAAGHARFHGADTSHILWTKNPAERMGLYFLEFGATPRPDSVLYDRAHSAISLIRPDMINWDALMARTRWFHVTGITPALSASAAETTERAVAAARARGVTVSLDLNYRVKLWTVDQARPVMERLSAQAHHLITTEEDADRLFGAGGKDFAGVAQSLRDRFKSQSVAVTVRQNLSSRHHTWTAVACDKKGIHEDRTYDLQIVDRVGGGDAFAAGYIYGHLKTSATADAVKYGNAVSALKGSVPGDVSFCTADEVEGLLSGTAGVRIQR